MNKKHISAKKILAALVAMVMVMAFMPAAFAATISISDCSVVEATVTVDVSLSQMENTMEHIIAIVTAEGDAANYDNAMAFQYARYTATNTNSLTLEILMPDNLPTGTYTVTVGSPIATNTASQKFSYMGYADRQDIMDGINGDDANAASLVVAFNSSPIALDTTGTKSAYYKVLSNNAKLQFAQYIIDHREEGDTDGNGRLDMTEVGAIANEAFLIVYSSNDTLSANAYEVGFKQLFKDLADMIGLDVEEDDYDERYAMIADSEGFFNVLRAQLGDDVTLETIESNLSIALTLQRINEVGYLVIGETIMDYGRELGIGTENSQITYDMLEEVTENKTIKDYFGKSMKATDSAYKSVRAGEKLPVTSVAQLEKTVIRAYEDAVKKYEKYLKELEDKKNNSGGNGGGGGTSSGTSSGTQSSIPGGGYVSSWNNGSSIPDGGYVSTGTDNGFTYTIDQNGLRPDPLGVKKIITDYYDDMTGYEWAASAVLALTESGIVSGTGDRKYEPERVLKREEFMKMLVNTFNLVDMTATCSFTDVSDTNAWYYIYIASAEKAGITTGRGDGTFGVGDDVTREEMATMVYRAARLSGMNLHGSGKNIYAYSDVTSLSAYAIEAVQALTENGVMNGGSDGKFAPQDGATRAQAAVVIDNINNLRTFK